MVSTRTTVVSICILAHHQPLLGLLDQTELRLYKSESDIVTFAQGEGYVQVSENGVLLLVEDAIEPDKLDRSDLESKLQEAEKGLESCEDGSEEQRRFQRDKRRWEAFLQIAEGGGSK